MARSKSSRTKWLKFFFFLYCCFMVWLLFFRSAKWVDGLNYEQQLRMNINLQPLLTIRNYWNVIYHRTNDAVLMHCIINLGGNILLFIPVGYFLPWLWPALRNFFAFLLTCTLAITLVELLQLVTLLGSLDIDDLILNLFGMILGYLFFIIFKK